jgi:predicted transcriptional regulator
LTDSFPSKGTFWLVARSTSPRYAGLRPGEDDWTVENRDEISATIEQGWQEAQRGELIDGDTVRAEMRKLEEDWIRQHRSA